LTPTEAGILTFVLVTLLGVLALVFYLIVRRLYGQGSINHLRAWIFGRCPQCGSVDHHPVKGWPKRECRRCGRTWDV
jgi:hypothetical protein